MNNTNRFEFLRFDHRSIGWFQVLLGISLIYNLVLRFGYAVELYGEHSIIPGDIMLKMNGPASYSVFDYIRNDLFSKVFIVIALLFCLGYIWGKYYRFFAIGLTFLYWNLLQGSSSFVFGFEFFSFQLLFWSCFLPVGHRLWFTKSHVYQKPYMIVCVALTIQIVWVYFATGIVKYGVSWHEGYAVRNMLMDHMATWGLASTIAGSAFLYKSLTYFTLFFELTFPFLIFNPYKNNITRLLAVVFLISFHLGIMLSYHVANFSVSGVAVAMLLIPAWLWDKTPARSIKPENAVPTANVWLKVFCFFAIYVISIKSIIFSVKYGSKKSAKTESTAKKLGYIDIPKLVKVSFFTQHWKMFAPNPPVKCGWLALEELKDNGDIIDVMSGQKVLEQPLQLWKPSGFEYYLLMYARNFDAPEGSSGKFQVFLKYWIPYKLKQVNKDKVDIKNIFLTDYLYIIANQKSVSSIPIKRNIIAATKIINQSFPVLENEPIN
ncbi:MAG: hypothetical protein M0D57_11165 [Sphingobacteriales bacterium JAD_PAG50586_3]|nr:MAG: hypothetical protein M0D57_11165 [Sphingobacteriales bacterium JAD_PAG50586_3]